jgi:hypothetical protein
MGSKMQMRRARLVLTDTGTLVATINVARTALARAVDMLGRTYLAERDSLLLECQSVHVVYAVLNRYPVLSVAKARSSGWSATSGPSDSLVERSVPACDGETGCPGSGAGRHYFGSRVRIQMEGSR